MSGAKAKPPTFPREPRREVVEKGAMNDEEIKGALKASGFPLEMRLLDAFHRNHVSAEIGPRVWTDDGEGSRELDLSTLIGATAGGVEFAIRGLVEAKSLEPWAAFVGFVWDRPRDERLRELRRQFGGRPAFETVPELEGTEDARIKIALAEALDPLNEPTVCFQWTIARRTDAHPEGTTGRGHEDDHWQSFDTLVRGAKWADAVATRGHDVSPLMLYHLPVVIVGTPKLYVYDAIKDDIHSIDEFLLYRDYETLSERVERRLVNIATEAAVPALIDRQRRALDRLGVAVGRHAVRLKEIAKAQTAIFEQETFDRLVNHLAP